MNINSTEQSNLYTIIPACIVSMVRNGYKIMIVLPFLLMVSLMNPYCSKAMDINKTLEVTYDNKAFTEKDYLNPELSKRSTRSAFGSYVGSFNGVDAYSNGTTNTASYEYNNAEGINTGMKWQCVEYVNRYYYNIYDIDLKSTGIYGNANHYYDNASKAGLNAYPNDGEVAPKEGDILCSNGGSYGHVAIVRNVTSSSIDVIHQNWSNTSSDNSKTLSRSGNYVYAFSSGYPVKGWLRLKQSSTGSNAYINSINFSDRTPDVGQTIKTSVTTSTNAYIVKICYGGQWFSMSGSGKNWTNDRIFESSGSKKIEVKTFDSNGSQVDYDYEYLNVSSNTGSNVYINNISFTNTTPEVGQTIRTTVTTSANAYRVEIRYDVQWHAMSGGENIWAHDRIFETSGSKKIEVRTLDSNGNQVDYVYKYLTVYSYSWQSGTWSSCNSNCEQSLSYYCKRSDGSTVNENYCSGTKPTRTQSCTGGNCTYLWKSGSWSSCNSNCEQSLSYYCKRSDGSTVSDGYCSGTKPTKTQSCTGGNCIYSWQSGSWSSCDSNCKQSLSYYCKRSDGSTVSDGYCSGTKPTKTQSCTGGNCIYSWQSGSWSSCNSNCEQTLSYYCKRSDGSTVSDGFCSGTKPTKARACTGDKCLSYSWKEGEWSACDINCQQTLSYYCKRSDDSMVSDSYCSGTKPTKIQSCNGDNCPSYYWKEGEWSVCDSNCEQTRIVTCQHQNGFTVKDSLCAGEKPVSKQACTDCNFNANAWLVSEYSTLRINKSFYIEAHVNIGIQKIGSYQFAISYDPNFIQPDNSFGNIVEKGPDGFLGSFNANQSGNIIINGFETNGKGPGSDLNIIKIHFKTLEQIGNTNLNLIVEGLTNDLAQAIGTSGKGTSISIIDTIIGDVNGDSNVSIADALLVARYSAKLTVNKFVEAAADVNSDQIISIADALLIARKSAGLSAWTGSRSLKLRKNTSSSGKVWLSPSTVNVFPDDLFIIEIHVDSGSEKLGSYQFELSFDQTLLNIDNSVSANGVEVDEDGFLSVANPDNINGKIIINGFDTNGKGPDIDLRIVKVYFKSLGIAANSIIDLSVTNFTNELGESIVVAESKDATVNMDDNEECVCSSCLLDVDGDKRISLPDIINGLQILSSFNKNAED